MKRRVAKPRAAKRRAARACLRSSLREWAGLALIAVSTGTVVVRAATSPAPRASRALSAEERRALARSLAAQESGWQERAARKFPGDRWSQDDDFFNQEHYWVRVQASQRGTSPGEILLGIDEELRAAPDQRKVSASPVKPRPFYD